jgi:transcriptional activator of cad operon
MLRVGEWRVNPQSGEMTRNGESVRLEVRTMRLLVCLAERAGEVLSIDELLQQVWPDVTVTSDSVYQAVASLRRALGDDTRQPSYIATVPRLGYKMVASVGPWTDEATAPTPPTQPRRWGARAIWIGGVAAAVAVVAALLVSTGGWRGRVAAHAPVRSVAVLPFLDLTEKMAEEEFADGLTEEIIGRLGKFPGYRVPAPASTFAFKGKHRSVGEIAKALDVTYVLDGSTRKSGDRLRVAARLIRSDSQAVVWSDSYDRSWGEMLAVQDEIADELTKALKASIDAEASRD